MRISVGYLPEQAGTRTVRKFEGIPLLMRVLIVQYDTVLAFILDKSENDSFNKHRRVIATRSRILIFCLRLTTTHTDTQPDNQPPRYSEPTAYSR